jgi:hypothetical protein
MDNQLLTHLYLGIFSRAEQRVLQAQLFSGQRPGCRTNVREGRNAKVKPLSPLSRLHHAVTGKKMQMDARIIHNADARLLDRYVECTKIVHACIR